MRDETFSFLDDVLHFLDLIVEDETINEVHMAKIKKAQQMLDDLYETYSI
jgi:hypothetical protein